MKSDRSDEKTSFSIFVPGPQSGRHLGLVLRRICDSQNDVDGSRYIFESLLTTFEASSIFEAVVPVAKIGLSLKPNNHNVV